MNNYKLVKNNEWKEVEINGEMKEIPNDWWVDILNNLCDVRDGTHESPKFIEKGIHFVTTKNLINGKIDFSSAKFISEKDHEDYSRRSKVDNGDILLGMIGTVGNPIMVKNKPFDFSIKNLGLIKTKNKINQNFLFFEFNKTIEEQKLKADGGVLKFMTLGVLRNIQIYYPSEVEQSSIASILSEQESIIQDIESLISKYESRFQYLSDELLSGRLRVKEVDGQTVLYKNPEDNWKEVEINGEDKEIPKDWGVKNVSQVSECWDNKRKPLNQTERSNKKGTFPYWGANNIVDYVNDYLVDEEVVLLGEDAAPFYDKTKKVAFVSNEKIWPNNHIHVLKPFINSYFLMTVLNAVQYEKIIGTNSRPKLTQGMMNSIEFFYPSQNEQTSIASILSNQENLIEEEKKLLSKEKQKFDWLLDNLLSGKYLIKE